LVVITDTLRVQRVDLFDAPPELPDALLDLVGRELLDLGRGWMGLAARSHDPPPWVDWGRASRAEVGTDHGMVARDA